MSNNTTLVNHAYGASLIREGCLRLREGEQGGEGGGTTHPTHVAATACNIFHQFFSTISFDQFDILLVAATSCLLASKTHDSASFVRSVVVVFDRIQQDRQHPTWSKPMYLLGTRHQTWCQALRQMESIMLNELSFRLYPFLVHPHRFIPFIATNLGLQPSKDHDFLQHVWNFINDCRNTTICIEYPPQVVAAAAFLRTAASMKRPLPTDFATTYGAPDYSLVVQAMEHFYTEIHPQTPRYMDSLAAEGEFLFFYFSIIYYYLMLFYKYQVLTFY